MAFPTYAYVGLLALFGGSALVNAVCPSNTTVAIGTPVANTATGQTQYKIYDNSCSTLQTLQVDTTVGICDSRYFMCAFGTKNIEEYDDPTTGRSYICAADTTSESCSGDTITYCCAYGLVSGS